MINLRKITEENFIDAFHLKLAPEQERFVSHPIRSLAQAYVYREQCQPFGIYEGDTMVGYVMVIYDYDIPEYNIWHMMIDESAQRQGYGRAALAQVLDYIKEKPFGPSNPVFRRSTRKVPAFSSSHFFTFSPEPRLFLYLRHIFNALWGLFLLKIFLEYSIIMVLYGTLLGGELWRTFYDRKKRKKDSICKCMTPTGTRR